MEDNSSPDAEFYGRPDIEYPDDFVFATEYDCRVCAIMLGIDPDTEQHLFWLARNFMNDNLNPEWTFIQEYNHFRNKKTGKWSWENPLKALYSQRVVEIRENRHLDLLAVDMIIPTDPPNDSKDCDTTSSDVVPQREVMEEQEAEGYALVVQDPVVPWVFEKLEEEDIKFHEDMEHSDNLHREIMEENKNKFYGEMQEEKKRFNGEMEEEENRPHGEMEEEENMLQRTIEEKKKMLLGEMEEKEKMLLGEMEEEENGLQREMTEKRNRLHMEMKYQKNMYIRDLKKKNKRLHRGMEKELKEIYGELVCERMLIFSRMDNNHNVLLRDTKDKIMRLHGEMEEKKNMLHGEMERTPPQKNTLPIPN